MGQARRTARRRPAGPRPRGVPTGRALVRSRLALGTLAVGALALAGCSSTPQDVVPSASTPPAVAEPSPEPTPGPTSDASAGAPGATTDGEVAPPVPGGHVHGLAIDGDGTVLVATHEGLVRYEDGGPVTVGPTVDLMGFALAPDRLYASGHAGPGSGLPEPMGLVESTDGGETWTVVSRGGQSDFHALTASAAGVVGFDGAGLWSTADGTEWERLDAGVQPYALAASDDGAVVLATTTQGPLRSTDGGRTWAPVEAPLLQLVAWGGRTAVGVTPDGTVAVSDDDGASWRAAGSIGGPPEGLAAAVDGDALRVVAVTGGTLVESRDGGTTFAPLRLP